MKRTPMTVRAWRRGVLRAELKRLKSDARPKVIVAIAEARAHGDLSENAEYHAAREQQGFIEGRINELEAKFANAEIIDPTQLIARVAAARSVRSAPGPWSLRIMDDAQPRRLLSDCRRG